MVELSYGTYTDTLVVGGGPSVMEYMKFIQEWKGCIICCDVSMKHLLWHGVRPQYMVVQETMKRDWNRDFTPEVIEYMKKHMLIIEKRPNQYGMRAERGENHVPKNNILPIKCSGFDTKTPNKINNVGLLAIIFCHTFLKLKTCHLIGFENSDVSLSGVPNHISPAEMRRLLSVFIDLYPFMKIKNWSPNHQFTDPRIITSHIHSRFKSKQWLKESLDYLHYQEYQEMEPSTSLKN